MTVLANKIVTFKKKGCADLAAFVRISEVDDKGIEQPHSIVRRYEVSFDAELRFSNGADIDGTTDISWPEKLRKPTRLTLPRDEFIPYNHRVAQFSDEQ